MSEPQRDLPAADPIDTLADCWASAWTGRVGFLACCTPDVSYEDPVVVEPLRGVEALAAHAGALRAAFPDLRLERSARRVSDGSHACLPWRALGTQHGELPDLPPTRRRVTLHGVHYVEIVDGHIRRARGFFDLCGVATQLGLLPGRGSLGETAILMLRGFGLRAKR